MCVWVCVSARRNLGKACVVLIVYLVSASTQQEAVTETNL